MAGAMISRAMICKSALSVAARAVALCANGKMGKRKPVFANCFVCAAQHELITGNKWCILGSKHLVCLNDECWRVLRGAEVREANKQRGFRKYAASDHG